MFPIDLLTPPSTTARQRLHDPADTARLLETRLRELAVAGHVRRIGFGPLVTTFEFEPTVGRLYRNIESVVHALAVTLDVGPVLIERAQDRSFVNVQIPNPGRETIQLRGILESCDYLASASALAVALGRTPTGEPYAVDLATMPHLLIAGSKGAGKSVGLLALLTSVVYRASPEEVRFVMIDSARSGLEAYSGIPHLLTPVVVDPGKASNALRWATSEMERRFEILAAAGVRNIAQYNRTILRAPADKRASTLPSIVIVVSELADLMMAAPFAVENAIARLAQMSRPVGIHLILATGHFSVGVLTGLVKAHLPARIAYRVRTRVESRTILDCNGAERLLGSGDMLFLPPASQDCVRLHGPYVSDAEASRVAEYLRRSGPFRDDPSITVDGHVSPVSYPAETDPLYGAAAYLVRTTGRASVSYLQRQLEIGFSRAVRLLDRIQTEGHE